MNEKQKYLQVLVEGMRSAGTGNWSYNDMADLCELAGMRHEWMVTETVEEELAVVLKAATALNVEVRHYVKEV